MEFVYEMPAAMLRETDRHGEVRRFTYDSRTYEAEDDHVLHKGAWVYLPYGYDAAKKYDILYLLHGGGVNEDWWFKMFPETALIVDNMIADGICQPCIIVTPTYYRGEEADKNAEYITEHFCHELRRDLIPAVESAFSTYAGGDVSEENLIKTRHHRAFAGLSLGSMTTYRAAFYNNYDLFSWYGPFSGCCGPNGDRDAEVKRIRETLDTAESKGLSLDYLFCCNGDKDIAFAEHQYIMERALQECPQLVQGKNYNFFIIPGGVHDMKAWQLHLYHALQIFFLSLRNKEADSENETDDLVDQEMEEEIIMKGIEIIKDCPVEVYETRSSTDYGVINHHVYHSETTGLDRGVNVLLPGNYDESKQYPVLYLLHGIFGDEYSLSGDMNNRLVEIMGNLQADGSAKEMIVVLPNMYASSDPDQKPAFNSEAVAPYDNFINDLVNDLIPFVEKTYSVLPGRENRAIAGFSMGGRETLFIGLSRPDLFAYVGAIAPAPGLVPGKDWAMTHPGQLKEDELTFAGKGFEPTVLMICCGTQDGTVGKFPESYHNIFERNGVVHTWYEITGADHDSQAIRSGLYNFARAVFKN